MLLVTLRMRFINTVKHLKYRLLKYTKNTVLNVWVVERSSQGIPSGTSHRPIRHSPASRGPNKADNSPTLLTLPVYRPMETAEPQE